MTGIRDQLALDLHHGSRFAGDRFIAGASNASARAWLAREKWPEGRLWIWGPSGTGKTHLLKAWARYHKVNVWSGESLHYNEEGDLLAGECSLRHTSGPLVIDHLDYLKNEVALLHVLNRSQEDGRKVLMAAQRPPGRKDFHLPDLGSRLRATMTAAVEEPEDELRATLLLSLLAERQLVVAYPVTEWLWRHLPRTGEALVQAVHRLDAAALERGTSITRGLAQEVLKDFLHNDEK